MEERWTGPKTMSRYTKKQWKYMKGDNQEKATTSGVMHERYQVSKQGHGKAGEVVQKGTTIRTGNSFSTFGDHQQEDGYKEGNYGRGYESNRKKG